jgi:hypothetical protein
MDYMDKRLSRMQRQFYFSKTDETDNNFRLEFDKHRIFLLGLPWGAGSRGPNPYPPPPESL